MRTYIRSIGIALAAMTAFALCTSAAGANTMTFEPAGTITATSLGKLTFNGTGGAINIAIECRVTLRGSLNRTINNVRGGAIGRLTEGNANECGTNSSVVFSSAWAMELNEASNLGTRPHMMKINIISMRVTATTAGVSCEYDGTIPTSLEYEGFFSETTRLWSLLFNTSRRIGGSALCPPELHIEGRFGLTTQTVRL